MRIDWTPLRAALSDSRKENVPVRLWWRDDDATKVTAALARLERLSDDLGVPVHIAVIPNMATAGLAEFFTASQQLVPVVHGWAHKTRAKPPAKKSEFGHPRDTAGKEILMALQQMRRLFGDAVLPMFVPPWNRIDPSVVSKLAPAGYQGLSTFTARAAAEAAPGVVQINTHIDPIDWRGTRSLIDPARLVTQTADMVRKRSEGILDTGEPLGYLTHHLVHTPELWEFSEQFLTELLQGGAEVQPIAPLLETAK